MIVVFGSINLDLVARVSQLPLPGQTLAGRSFSMQAGGKGANQALAARRAGAEVALFGAVGRDAFAQPALALLQAGGVALDGVREVDLATGVAMIHVDDAGENAITIIAGANGAASEVQVPDVLLGPDSTVLLQFEAPAEQSLALAMRAHARGARVVLNPAPVRSLGADWPRAIDVLVANEHEAAIIARELALPDDPDAFACAFADRHGVATVVTCGPAGVVATTRASRLRVPALPVEAIDSVGAGDAFVGVLAAALDRGASLADAIVQGAAAGGLACTREGAQPSLPVERAIAQAAIDLRPRLQATAR